MRNASTLLAALGLAGALATPAARAESVLHVVPQADISIFDPHVTAATVTTIFGLMVYDTLYALDGDLKAQKEMVGTEKVSDDKLTYDFTLRDGLVFNSGEKVTSADVIASIERAGKQVPLIQLMLKRKSALEATGDNSFRITFPKPFPYVELAMAEPRGVVMRAADLKAAGDAPVRTTDGEGPFRFVTSQYNTGAKLVFEKNPDYKPIDAPASGNAGGKRVLVDRVQWDIIPDLQTRINALKQGQVDLLDQLPHDGIAQLRGQKGIEVGELSKFGNMGFLRMNETQPPFNDARARHAMALLVNQKDYLSAAFTTDQQWWQPCYSFFGCNNPNSSDAGSEPYQKPDVAKAKQLLAEAGYKGEKVTVLTTQEIPLIDALAEVTADELKSAGVNVDLVTSDWGTLVKRRAQKTGWNIFDSGIDTWVLAQPATNLLIDARCDGNNYVGWPCSEKLEAMRTDIIDDPSPAKFEAYSRALWQELPTILLGQYKQPIAWRSVVSGIPRNGFLVFWNISKK